MRIPAVRVLFIVFVYQDGLKRAAMQVEIQHIRGCKRGKRKSADKEFVDGPVPLDANGRSRFRSRVGGDDQAHGGSSSGQRDGWTIIKRTRHAAFRVGAHVVWSAHQATFHRFQVQQMIGTASRDHRQTRREDIEKGSCVAIQAIQPQQDGGWGKPKAET